MKLSQSLLQVIDNKPIYRNPPAKSRGIFYWAKQVLLLVFAGASLAASAQPKLEIKDAKENFGFVKRGTLVKNEFEISNAGNAPLVINDVEIACSCTTVDYPKQPIMPGQKATVTVNFNTASVYGRQDREVFLLSNDPKGRAKLRYKDVVSNK